MVKPACAPRPVVRNAVSLTLPSLVVLMSICCAASLIATLLLLEGAISQTVRGIGSLLFRAVFSSGSFSSACTLCACVALYTFTQVDFNVSAASGETTAESPSNDAAVGHQPNHVGLYAVQHPGGRQFLVFSNNSMSIIEHDGKLADSIAIRHWFP